MILISQHSVLFTHLLYYSCVCMSSHHSSSMFFIFHHVPITNSQKHFTVNQSTEEPEFGIREESLFWSGFQREAAQMVHEEWPVSVLHNPFYLRSWSIFQLTVLSRAEADMRFKCSSIDRFCS